MMPDRLDYLFVCYANMDRSPTAEAVCTRIAEENDLDIVASSAGISNGANRPVTKHMADLAVVNTRSPRKPEDGRIYSKCGWSPYQGMVFPGGTDCTIYRGRVIMKHGEVLL